MDNMDREAREIGSVGEWLAWRRQDITASRIAALFDAHPYLTRAELAAGLRGKEGSPPNSAMRCGRILEPAVAAAIAEEHPEWTLAKATTYHRLPDHRIGCTPDYWLDDDGLIQVKTVAPQEWDNWRGKVPLAYTLQTLTELMVTDRARGVLAIMVCSPSYPLHLFDVPRHAGAEQRLLHAAAAWWQDWDEGVETPLTIPGHADLADMLDDGTHADLSGDNVLPAILTERAELKAVTSTAEKRLAEIDARIKAKLGPARTAYLPGWSISYATSHRKETLIPAKDIRTLRVKATMEEC